jgi:hypothetical protein
MNDRQAIQQLEHASVVPCSNFCGRVGRGGRVLTLGFFERTGKHDGFHALILQREQQVQRRYDFRFEGEYNQRAVAPAVRQRAEMKDDVRP